MTFQITGFLFKYGSTKTELTSIWLQTQEHWCNKGEDFDIPRDRINKSQHAPLWLRRRRLTFWHHLTVGWIHRENFPLEKVLVEASTTTRIVPTTATLYLCENWCSIKTHDSNLVWKVLGNENKISAKKRGKSNINKSEEFPGKNLCLKLALSPL